jgi:hypothetical protein
MNEVEFRLKQWALRPGNFGKDYSVNFRVEGRCLLDICASRSDHDGAVCRIFFDGTQLRGRAVSFAGGGE